MKFGGATVKFSRLTTMVREGRTRFAVRATKPSL
jgi:hypothetical protein